MFYLWEYLKSANKPIVLYGMGNGADLIIKQLNSINLNISGVFASDGFVKNKEYQGFKIKSFSDIKKEFNNFIVLVAFGSSRPEVIENIINISKECELFVPDVPVYGNNIFDRSFVKNNKQDIKKTYSLLADEKSKKVFENIIRFKAGGEIKYLLKSETSYSEDIELLNLKNNEIFFDLGAYNGDTVLDFVKTAKTYNKIIAVEPDSKTFKKLEKNLKDISNIQIINKAISDCDGIVKFNFTGSRGSALKNNIGSPVETVCIDTLMKKSVPTFIKFDIEGAEEKAIVGAYNTIKNYKPKMQIATYHRSEDIFKIPLLVNGLNPDYKIYLRHQPSFPAWDTNYYFI